ncbi:MAG: hypothetical protein RR292_07695 [Christensenellaceae bacterium]
MAEERIVLGSGTVYIDNFTGAVPADAIIETADNLLGLIQGGATLEYKPEYYTATDDMGIVKKTILTKEEATFKSGVMTWNGGTLKKLCATARITETQTLRTVKIGGITNEDKTSYVVRFVHEDAVDGDIRLTIVGKNSAGFSLAFAKDKETVIDAEFACRPMDKEGTLIIYAEQIIEQTAGEV